METECRLYPTVRAPITSSDLADSSYDTLFLIVELSDAMRRGVTYFSLEGEPLDSLNHVIDALVQDGEVAFDDKDAADLIHH